MMHKKACKQFAEDKHIKDMDYWNHVLWSDETKINLFGLDGVKHVWQSMIPSLRRLGRRAVFQHDNDHCLANETEGKGYGLSKHVSRPKLYRASVGYPQTEGGGAQGLKHRPAPWCRHGGVEEDFNGKLWSSGELHAQEG